MDSIAHYFMESDSEDDLDRRSVRATSSPLTLPETTFRQLFRLSKEAFAYILEEISGDFKINNSNCIPPITKLAATLRLLAEGSYQRGVGQDYHIGLAQQSVSKFFGETLEIIEKKLCSKWIALDTTEYERTETKKGFYENTGYPGVIGCIDGSHISIVKPSISEHIYFNRKGYHSLNIMLICDHKLRIKAVNARYGGSCHDSMIWSLSSVREYLQRQWRAGDTNSWLIADSGYPLEPWIITPFRAAAAASPEARFNTLHSKARNPVERCIGLLKARFRALLSARQLHYTPEKASRIVNVCCVLHNICIHYGVDWYDDIPLDNDAVNLIMEHTSDNSTTANIARKVRDRIKNAIL